MSAATRSNDLNAFLSVDDLRVGGIQRLVMDEAYALAEQGYCVQIINFGAEIEKDSILHVDGMTSDQLSKKTIFITNLSGDNFSKFSRLRMFIKQNEVRSVICHSPSASFWFRLAALSLFRQMKISLWIHQVLTLSDPVQATKRVILSTTASKLFFSAVQFKLEWEANPADRLIRKLRGAQCRAVDRLGVYLPRVMREVDRLECKENAIHIIYASRLTPWKGLDKFDQIIKRNPNFHPVVLSVNVPKSLSSASYFNDEYKDHLLICKSPSYLSNLNNSVHIYPTCYGNQVRNPQSIGLNVMEFALMGIPSLVSHEVTSTYPELLESTLVEVVDWHDKELVDRKVQSLACLTQSEREVAARMIQEVCSIENHVDTLKSNLLGHVD
jgi:glycosyltransferase involved in cell wall biosynthesis